MVDFDYYWQDVRDEHEAVRKSCSVDWEIIPRCALVTHGGYRWQVDWLRYTSVGDIVLYGWVGRPLDHESTGAALLWLPGYSYGTPLADATNLIPGAVTLAINVHGRMPDEPYVNPAGKNDYITAGIDSPSSFIYRSIVLHCLNAMDVLGELEWVDASRTVVGGMSQGGMLALLVAAHHRAPKICFADMPFLCNAPEAMHISHSSVYKTLANAIKSRPESANAILDTLCLFDPLRHADRITIPVALSAGGKDPASPASTIEPVYDAIASTIKQYRFFPKSGHVFLPEMMQTYIEWIAQFVCDGNRHGNG